MSRVVVITGGTSGMGLATALKFAKNGDTVYVLGRRPDKVEEASKSHKNITGIICDVTKIDFIQEAVDKISSKHKHLDVLVNAAGGNVKIAEDATITEELAVFNQVVETNLTSMFLVINMFKGMMKSGGRIINITSLAALTGSSQPAATGQAYAAAKAGAHGLTRTLAKVLGHEGITVNSVAPGVIEKTDFFGEGGVPDRIRDAYKDKIIMGRLGVPEDIAEGVFYLASENSSYVTGEILNINGGVEFGR